MQKRYVECLKKELSYRCKELMSNSEITTIYIGGGTPSFIDSKYIKEIVETIKNENIQAENSEVTIEVNPSTVTERKLLDYKEAEVNRLSIGLQSCSNRLLKEIGRIHTYEQFLETYNMAREVGFNNINVDLMLGLPNQSIDDLKESLNQVIELQPEHISVYSLILEEDTILYEMVQSKKIVLSDDEQERMMYWYVKNTLELHGYKHYEISNYAKPGFESKHNINCWNQQEYIGVGLNASSYMNGVRYSNVANLDEYMQNAEAGCFDNNKIIEEVQNKVTKQKEFMLLGLRMIDGISIQKFKNKYKENPVFLFKNELNKLVNSKLLSIDGDAIKLTNTGINLANQVWMEFV